jgi:hypothetical protein
MSDTTKLLIEFGVIVLCAALVGTRVAREASHREKIYSGTIGTILNLISAMAVASLLPGVLVALLLGGGHFAVPIALSLLTITLISLVLFALVELPHHKALPVERSEEEELWTAEKARTSGL